MTKYESGNWKRAGYLVLTLFLVGWGIAWAKANYNKQRRELNPPHQHTIDKWSEPEIVIHWNYKPFFAQWAICNECGELLERAAK